MPVSDSQTTNPELCGRRDRRGRRRLHVVFRVHVRLLRAALLRGRTGLERPDQDVRLEVQRVQLQLRKVDQRHSVHVHQ